MRNSLNNLLQELTQKDLDTLKSIYFFRCLTEEQIYELHYQKESQFDEENVSKTYVRERIQYMIDNELIKKVYYKKIYSVYFLTSMGVELIRYYFEFPANVYDYQKKVIKRGYYRASELEIHPKNINHQLSLNQFVIDFKKIHLNVQWRYYDEKYVSQYSGIRPDGLISILDTDFFLEMDMSTESKKQLYNKWDNYRNFLNSREYAYREKKIVVLFIVEGTNDAKKRIDLIKYTIYDRLLDQIDSDFEIYVGTSKDLLNLLKKRLIPAIQGYDPYMDLFQEMMENTHGFTCTNGERVRHVFNDIKYQFYMRKLNEKQNIIIDNGKVQEFVTDDYISEPASVIAKIAYFNINNVPFQSKYKREISYLVVGKSEEQLFHDLKMADLINLPNIYFSTFQRLKELPFHQALFQFDTIGNLYHFNNNGLKERTFEKQF